MEFPTEFRPGVTATSPREKPLAKDRGRSRRGRVGCPRAQGSFRLQLIAVLVAFAVAARASYAAPDFGERTDFPRYRTQIGGQRRLRS